MEDEFKIGALVMLGIVALIGLIVVFGSFTIIDAGTRGIVFSKISGVKPAVMNEGFNFKTPLIDSVIVMDVKTQKIERDLSSTSQDQQVVKVKVAVNFRADENSITKLYQEVGRDYVSKVIMPAVDESTKAAMAQFKAEELLKSRSEVSAKALEILRDKLKARYVIIENLNVLNIDFSELYNAAIEAKVTAEQQSFKAENDLKRIEVENKQKVSQAQAQADSELAIAQAQAKAKLLIAEADAKAITLQNEALKNSEKVLELKRIEKWNGEVPQTMIGDSQGLIYNLPSQGVMK
jgi:regulator of protease activity HflC (stomatin/prohibitin superfamily)